MEVLIYAFIFFAGLCIFFGCVFTDNPSPIFDIGFIVGFIITACSGLMMLLSPWSDIIDRISLLFQ